MAVMVAGSTAGQFVTLLTAPIISRCYEPSMFGTFGVYSSITIMISMVATLRYDNALMLPKDDRDALNLLAVSISSVLTFSLLSWGVCFMLEEIIKSSAMGVYETDLLSIFIPLGVLLTGLYQSLSAWAVRKKSFPAAATSHASRSIISSLTKILAGWRHAHAFGLIYGQLAGDLVAILNLMHRAFWADRFCFRSCVNLRSMMTLARKNLDFAVYGSGQLLVGAAALQVPILLMAKYYGKTNVGFYTLAISMIQFPLAMVQNSLRQVFLQKACETFNRNGDVHRLLKETTLWLYSLFLAPAIVIFLFGPELFRIIFGSQWTRAGVFAQCIIPASFIAFPKVPALTLTRVYRKQKQLLLLESLFLGSEIILYMLFAERIEIVHLLVLHAMIMSIYNIWLITWMLRVSKKRDVGGLDEEGFLRDRITNRIDGR